MVHLLTFFGSIILMYHNIHLGLCAGGKYTLHYVEQLLQQLTIVSVVTIYGAMVKPWRSIGMGYEP